MGIKADKALVLETVEELGRYLRANHAAYMEVDGEDVYLTNCNDNYWRAQDTSKLNEKGHFTDASELVPTVGEFLDIVVKNEKTITELFKAGAKIYASVKPEPAE